MNSFNGKLIVLSAPSGSGKTTLVKHLLASRDDLSFSISCTTRDKREGEIAGKDYYFLTKDVFLQRVANGEFAEHEEVYPGVFYGTLDSEIKRIWNRKKHVIFDVDVLGGLSIKRKYPTKSLSIFVKAPSKEAIKNRLQSRGTEQEENIDKRMQKVDYELSFANQFDVVLVNDDLEIAKIELQDQVADFLSKD